MPPPFVTIAHLTKTYGGRTVVDDLTFSVATGSVTVLLGPNGAGKSTTLDIVATLRLPSSGHVEIAGLDVVRQTAEARRELGHVPQANALDPLMTTRETFAFQLRALGFTGRHGTARVDDVIALLSLAATMDTRVAALSGGTRRRVDLGLALLRSPRLLILDEPTTGLDPASRLSLWGELRRLVRDDGLTLLMSTQDLHEAEALATHLVVLRDGALLADGSPADLKRAVGERTLRVQEPTLDDVFAALTGMPSAADSETAPAVEVVA